MEFLVPVDIEPSGRLWVENSAGFEEFYCRFGGREGGLFLFGLPLNGAAFRINPWVVSQDFERARFEYDYQKKAFSLGRVNAELKFVTGSIQDDLWTRIKSRIEKLIPGVLPWRRKK